MRSVPAYNSGVLELYEQVTETIGDYPKKALSRVDIAPIWYRELAVYDRTRIALEEAGKQITLKVQIPQYREIDSNFYVLIDGRYHKVFNAAHGLDKDGYPMTEITLIAPENNLKETA